MKWVIAGGGTGGHLFPGMAIAEAFVEREMGNEVLFIGTERGIETRVLAGGKFPLKTIQARPIKGRSLLGKGRAIWTMPKAISEAFSILKNFQPQLVLGVGGYASGPTLLAAFLLRIKRAIHEQNVVPGMTNRFLKRFSQRIFVSFEETKRYFPEGKTFITGNPIRKEILACLPACGPKPASRSLGEGRPSAEDPAAREGRKRRKEDRFTLLIFGGSAGAHRINEAMMEALDSLKEIKSSLMFIHQTGREDLDFVSRSYQGKGFNSLVRPFFEEMATYYQISDLVICRSGASTIAELAICGKAAIFIPYPYAAHHHQSINAQKLVDRGAARMIEDEALSGPLLAQTILHLYTHPEERARMGEAIQEVGRPKAAQEIVDHCYALMEKVVSPSPLDGEGICR
jgi:UDP-N-acetylglucosamine--N-acetylmuramyl-(pentapeptide) pyrophosphoryl-undecaprenol N-acetylglucosamine transferase